MNCNCTCFGLNSFILFINRWEFIISYSGCFRFFLCCWSHNVIVFCLISFDESLYANSPAIWRTDAIAGFSSYFSTIATFFHICQLWLCNHSSYFFFTCTLQSWLLMGCKQSLFSWNLICITFSSHLKFNYKRILIFVRKLMPLTFMLSHISWQKTKGLQH